MTTETVRRQLITNLVRAHKLQKRLAYRRRGAGADGRRGAFYEAVWRQEAAAVGASIEFIQGRMADIRRGGAVVRVHDNLTSIDDPVTRTVASDKPLVLRLLEESGIPVPRHIVCRRDDIGAAWRFLRQTQGQVVVKPARHTGAGEAVTTGVARVNELVAAMVRAGSLCEEVVVEQQVEGSTFRLLYLDGELLDAVERRHPTVRGDGRSTLRELLAAENEARAHGGIEASQTMLRTDAELRNTLKTAGLTLDSVPAEGVVVRVKNVINDNRREDNVAAAERICSSLRAEGARAAAAVGVRLAGVDVITSDPSVPLAESGGVVIEVNTSPGFYYHYLRSGGACPVARLILERLFAGEGAGSADGVPAVDSGLAGPEGG
jgi:cyanophycin synthetase